MARRLNLVVQESRLHLCRRDARTTMFASGTASIRKSMRVVGPAPREDANAISSHGLLGLFDRVTNRWNGSARSNESATSASPRQSAGGLPRPARAPQAVAAKPKRHQSRTAAMGRVEPQDPYRFVRLWCGRPPAQAEPRLGTSAAAWSSAGSTSTSGTDTYRGRPVPALDRCRPTRGSAALVNQRLADLLAVEERFQVGP